MALLFVITSITVGAVIHIFRSDAEVLAPSPKEKSSYELLQKEKKEVEKKLGKSSSSGSSNSKVKKLTPGEKININTADIFELMRVPGVGEKTATDIVALRINLGGKFTHLSQLKGIKSIGEKKLQKLKEFMVLTDE
jgi:competence ComEA-like helix-hairpin-helix protein